MTTSEPKPTGYDTFEDVIAFLGGWPKWYNPAAVTVPPFSKEERANANRALVSGLFHGNGRHTQPTQNRAKSAG